MRYPVSRPLVIVLVFAVTGVSGFTAALAGGATLGPLVQVSGTSPFASCTADSADTQPGTNFPGSEVEPWIDVNPTNDLNIVGSFQQDRWSAGGARGLVARVSTDGGSTWTQVVIPNITVCSGGNAANGGDFNRATDPWLSFAPNGDLYHFSLSVDVGAPQGSPGGFGKSALLVSKSTDGGLTWGNPITIARNENPRVLNDKNSITADPNDANFVYAVWDRLDIPRGVVINPENVRGLGVKGPIMFSRTTNAGSTWAPARIIYNPAANNSTIGSQIVVQPNGTLVNFFTEFTNFKNSDGGSQFDANLSLLRSTDKGATWTRGRPIRAAKMLIPRVTDPETGAPVRTGDILPEVAVDPSSGNLYAVWQDTRFNGVSAVAFSMSTDGGFTWSSPIKVNQTPASEPIGDQQAFTPSVDVSADGTIAVTYYDFRNNTASPSSLETDYFIVHCHPETPSTCTSAGNWGNDEARLTNASFDMQDAPVAQGFFIGDYEGLASVDNDFLVFFSQTHPGDPASIFFRRASL